MVYRDVDKNSAFKILINLSKGEVKSQPVLDLATTYYLISKDDSDFVECTNKGVYLGYNSLTLSLTKQEMNADRIIIVVSSTDHDISGAAMIFTGKISGNVRSKLLPFLR
jgi:hypothetical protein